MVQLPKYSHRFCANHMSDAGELWRIHTLQFPVALPLIRTQVMYMYICSEYIAQVLASDGFCYTCGIVQMLICLCSILIFGVKCIL